MSAFPEFSSGFVMHSMVDIESSSIPNGPSICGDHGDVYMELTSATGGVQGEIIAIVDPLTGLLTACVPKNPTVFFQDIATVIIAP